jgi:hypothetical protein
VQQLVRVLRFLSRQNLVHLRVQVFRVLDLGSVRTSEGPTQSTHRLAELEQRLAGNERLFVVVDNLGIDDVDRLVELASFGQ